MPQITAVNPQIETLSAEYAKLLAGRSAAQDELSAFERLSEGERKAKNAVRINKGDLGAKRTKARQAVDQFEKDHRDLLTTINRYRSLIAENEKLGEMK